MKHIKTLNTKSLQNTVKKGGCGECQTSCQSACKTSCTVGNQSCEIIVFFRNNKNRKKNPACRILFPVLEKSRKG